MEEVYTCAPRAGAARAGYNGLIGARFDYGYTSSAQAVFTKGDTAYRPSHIAHRVPCRYSVRCIVHTYSAKNPDNRAPGIILWCVSPCSPVWPIVRGDKEGQSLWWFSICLRRRPGALSDKPLSTRDCCPVVVKRRMAGMSGLCKQIPAWRALGQT